MKVMVGWMERKLDLCLVGYQNVALMFLFFPLDETVFIQGVTKDVIEDEAKQRKNDLLKIRKYLVRQTYTEGKLVDYEGWKDLKKLSFPQFLVDFHDLFFYFVFFRFFCCFLSKTTKNCVNLRFF